MRKILFNRVGLLSICFILSLSSINAQDLAKYVDPFIGTAFHGHTYPGAQVPFGMVQLSPDTGVKDWDWCSGYHASDNSIMGFSHTHLSGTGGADYGDVLLMPTIGEIKLLPGSKENPVEGYRSRFSHDNEKASAGYYSVLLDDYNINVELTTTTRVGFHKYTFPKSDKSNIIVDLKHGISDQVFEANMKVVGNNKIVGLRRSSGWAKDQYFYFVIEFSKPFESFGIAIDDKLTEGLKEGKGKNVKGVFSYSTEKNEEILVKVAVSAVSVEGAEKNLTSELPEWDFSKTRKQAYEMWNEELSHVIAETEREELKTIFYTALYHTMIVPTIFTDVDGKYRGMDYQIHEAKDYTHFTLFSLWDTFRGAHPLYTIVDPDRANDFARSLTDKAKQLGTYPIWELAANDTEIMIGYHAVSVIADAIIKGIDDFDVEAAYELMKKSAMQNRLGIDYHREMGFVPMDKEDDAASKTLEYAYDDWCIAQVAKKLGHAEDYNYFIQRAQNYKNLFDVNSGFIRARTSEGKWKRVFDPAEPFPLGSGEFAEGSSWQYTWSVFQDVNGLIDLMGGDKKFEDKLDLLFSEESRGDFEMPADVTGLIGNYSHGNEPSHHIAYLYNFVGVPWKCQGKVRKIMDELYTTERDGICGNEDCGQMSAWYVLSAMGFYSVTPGSDEYILGSPIFDKVTIKYRNGNKLVIVAKNNSKENKYINSIKIDGEDYPKSFITHAMIENGGTIEIEMTSEPNKNFGYAIEDRPVRRIEEKFIPVEEAFLFPPHNKDGVSIFVDSKSIELCSFTKGAEIYYTLDGSEPNKESTKYTKPIAIDDNAHIKAIAYKAVMAPSPIYEEYFSKAIYFNTDNPYFQKDGEIFPKISYSHPYSGNYTGGSDNALLDGVRGTTNFRDGTWQGFVNGDLDVTVDLGKKSRISGLSVGFLRNQGSWIFFPLYVELYASVDGTNYQLVKKVEVDSSEEPKPSFKKDVRLNFETVIANYLRIKAKNILNNPSWHSAAGGSSFIFVDEIIIEKE